MALARLSLARPQNLGVVVALVALALAACAHSGSTPTPISSSSPTPIATGTIRPGCASVTSGVAYLPDGGNGAGFSGIQQVHFEDFNGNLCATTVVFTVAFAGPVGPFWIAPDDSVALAAYSATNGPPFTLIQDVFGASQAGLVPVGAGYDVTTPPTPVPSTTPTAFPSPLPVLSDVASITTIGSGSASDGLIGGIGDGFLGLTSLTNAPPQFGGFVPFPGSSPNPGDGLRPNLALSSDSTVFLARGPSDVIAYSIQVVGTGYQFTTTAFSTALGYGAGRLLRGTGAMAINPTSASHAILLQAPGGNDVSLVTNLPTDFTGAPPLTLPSRPHSVAITNAGSIAAIGADNGVYVVMQANGVILKLVPPFAPNPSDPKANAPTFVGCDGHTYRMTNVTSVRISADQHYLIIVGQPPTQSCASGYDSSLIAVPFNPTTGGTPSPAPSPSPGTSPSPVPTMYTANGLVKQPVDSDYLIVR